MFWKSSNKVGCSCSACTSCGYVTAAFLGLATIASLLGVYKAHFLSTGLAFGTTSGSLALIAFAITLVAFSKAVHSCCPCSGCVMPPVSNSKKK